MADINAILIFTTQSGLTPGKYTFTKNNTVLDTFHLAGKYNLEPFSENFNFFFGGLIGYSEIARTNEVNQTSERLTTDNMLRTYSAALGGGIRYFNDSGFSLSGEMELVYSRMGYAWKKENKLGKFIEDLFDSSYVDILTFHVTGMAKYQKEWNGFFPYAVLLLELYETKSAFSVEQITKFTTQSSVANVVIGVESPPLVHYNKMYMSLEGYFVESFLGSDLPQVVGFDRYSTVGGLAYWYVPNDLKYIRRFYIEVSTTHADGMHGYNIGLGFSLDYAKIYDTILPAGF